MITTRVYLAQIIGSGADEDEFRSALDDHTLNYAKSRRVFGADGVMWMMANVKASNQAPMLEDERMMALPDFAPTTLVVDMAPEDVMAILGALSYYGLPAEVLTTAAIFRDVIHGVGQHLLGKPWNVANFLNI